MAGLLASGVFATLYWLSLRPLTFGEIEECLRLEAQSLQHFDNAVSSKTTFEGAVDFRLDHAELLTSVREDSDVIEWIAGSEELPDEFKVTGYIAFRSPWDYYFEGEKDVYLVISSNEGRVLGFLRESRR